MQQTKPTIHLSDVLISRKEKNLLKGDFTCGYIDNYLPDDFFRALRDSFPASEEMVQSDTSYYSDMLGMLATPTQFETFIGHSPEWNNFLNLIQTDAFAQDIQSCFNAEIKKSFGIKAVRKKWANLKKYTNNRLIFNWKRINHYPVFGTLFLSRLNRGFEVEPHNDSRRKMISMILYLRPDSWRDEWGGNTVFFKLKDSVPEHKWTNALGEKPKPSHVAQENLPEFYQDFEELISIDYKANRLAFFVMDELSYHCVRPLLCPEGSSRAVAIINNLLSR